MVSWNSAMKWCQLPAPMRRRILHLRYLWARSNKPDEPGRGSRSMLRIQAASQTDPGKVREQNEDYCYFQMSSSGDEARGLFIVADGMGGYQAGEVASKLAVDEIRETLNPLFAPSSGQETVALTPTSSPEGGARTRRLPESREVVRINERLKQAITKANEVIVNYGKARKEARGLGSTVTVAVVLGSSAYIANVGDSRTYLLRNGQLRAI